MGEIKKLIKVPSEVVEKLFGAVDENIETLRSELNVLIRNVDEGIEIIGEDEDVDICEKVIASLTQIIATNEYVDKGKIKYCIELAKEGLQDEIKEMMKDVVSITSRGKQIRCKTMGQKKYVDAIKKNQVVFGVGPAGTGKTYLAVALAVVAFKNKEVEKIILTRPAVEAGEKLGFLPGDLQMKVDPYLRPLYDALQEMFGLEQYQKLIEKGSIEIAPLAYMRGRTLSNAFIILDEAQNTTREQMKMFLTRMGEGSRMIVTGDITQIDLPDGKASGLKHAISILHGIEDIAIVHFSHKDVVRHELVMSIFKAYEKAEEEKSKHRE